MAKRGVAWRRWQGALSGYWDSGLTVAEYCRRHGLRPRAAGKWLKRLPSEMALPSETLEIVQLPMMDLSVLN